MAKKKVEENPKLELARFIFQTTIIILLVGFMIFVGIYYGLGIFSIISRN